MKKDSFKISRNFLIKKLFYKSIKARLKILEKDSETSILEEGKFVKFLDKEKLLKELVSKVSKFI